jgi:CheY-like chemotaxis protein
VRLDGVRVLVVDDDADAREVISTILGWAGAEVILASSSDEAIAGLASVAPHILISDIGMPGDDGYALMRKVRDAGSPLANVPAIALTAYAGPGDAYRAKVAGFDRHIVKPVDPALLTAVVAMLASSSGPAPAV